MIVLTKWGDYSDGFFYLIALGGKLNFIANEESEIADLERFEKFLTSLKV